MNITSNKLYAIVLQEYNLWEYLVIEVTKWRRLDLYLKMINALKVYFVIRYDNTRYIKNRRK